VIVRDLEKKREAEGGGEGGGREGENEGMYIFLGANAVEAPATRIGIVIQFHYGILKGKG